ncbi:MAG TPA: TOBE domain-containing protein [Candidatus Desulfovibrio intestinavium]|uniref:TOBE domain-containing protein n=1 Tax=Candidatus Desulfovibrio intestinavium TaxID=2838534 RepID=A0A9D2HMD5_9BACT|nr:TOBE domain-containing protein [Candidatus Desulfovibrio intestinavium]
MTDNARDRERLENLWRSLSLQDREWLRRRLLPRGEARADAGGPLLSESECRAAERWFEARCSRARTARDAQARLRLWCIFLLLRYGGLRLVEIFALRAEDWDWTQGCVHVRGRAGRGVPLPLPLVRRLRDRLAEPAFLAVLARPVCDDSLVRRSLAACGRACGLPSGLLSARSLRRNRERELLRLGLSPEQVDGFLGRNLRGAADGNLTPPAVLKALRERIQGDDISFRSSARNTFAGRVLQCAPCGLACRVELLTPGGILLTAIITETSRRQLDVREGCRLVAQVKAPQVHLAGDGCPPPPEATHFGGEVESLRSDARWREVLLRLADGSRVCILQDGVHQPFLCVGLEVRAWFGALSVILAPE